MALKFCLFDEPQTFHNIKYVFEGPCSERIDKNDEQTMGTFSFLCGDAEQRRKSSQPSKNSASRVKKIQRLQHVRG